MSKQIHALITILIVSSWSTADAASTATGSVLWNFNVTPTSVSFANSGGYFGSVDGMQGYLSDPHYSTTLQAGASSIHATWDPVTGNATDYGLTAVNTNANVGYAIAFSLTTDILSFSYDYDFFGQRDSTDAGNNVSMGVQVEISDGNQIFYTDYTPSDPTFRTNWAYFELEGTQQMVLDEAGNISYEYGEAGVTRTWYISMDVLASGSDTVGAVVPLPASLPLLLCGLTFLTGLRRRHNPT